MDSQVMVALALSLVGGLSTSIVTIVAFGYSPTLRMDTGFSCFLYGFTHLNEMKNNTTSEGFGSVFFGVEVCWDQESLQLSCALFVILFEAPNLKMLGLLQGFAAGLMLSISFLDLAHNAINSIGFLKGNLWFFGGVVFFGIIANFIPEPTFAPGSDVKSKKKNGDQGGKDIIKKHRRQVLFSGIITAIGISLHNFPEGMAVFLGSIKGLRVGLNLALAIALHNIPEGVAVALPIYFATQSKWQAFKLATVSGFAEPLGVVLVAYLFPSSLSPEILEGLLASVGGVMAFLTLHEMLPLAFDYAGQKQAVKAVFFGMAFMSASLYFLEISLPEEMSL
ncbi:hypothetical protein POTOM_003712 [Populus tomentosa]|uniref:Zinc transporter ZTP29 n=1 Tax=Populus tomentosa TaxID=118781 RepID=A0A8X8DES5_POPTO|nr:hypothetical protein POTOM_003712 [Populus tomentosa]